MKKITEFFKIYKLPLLSGLLIGTSYIPLPPWAILFCYVPLWIFWSNQKLSLKQVFWGGFWTQFVLNLIGFHWIIVTAHDFGQLPWIVSFFALLAFAALSHVFFPLVGLLVFYLRKKNFISQSHFFLWLAALWALAEYYWPYIFQWHLGYTLIWAQFPAFQFADIIGFHGLSFMLLLFNAAFAKLTLEAEDRRIFFKRSAALILVFFVINTLGSAWGFRFTHQLQSQEKNFLVVQGNIGNLERVYAERGAGYQDYIANTYFRMTQAGLEKANSAGESIDLIIWPESAFPEYLDAHYLNGQRARLLQSEVRGWATPLLTGSYSKDPPTEAKKRTYNALSLFEKTGELNQGSPYHKYHLLAFGEYTPLANLFPFLENISPAGSGFGRGSGPRTLNLDGLFIGPQICYEALYPEHTRSLANQGAEVLINLTNDSWFGSTFEPEQHLYMTLARAIEIRRPLIRATNTGITTAIEASGQIHPYAERNKDVSVVYKLKVPPNKTLTLFSQFGHFFPLLVLIFLGGLVGIQRFKKS